MMNIDDLVLLIDSSLEKEPRLEEEELTRHSSTWSDEPCTPPGKLTSLEQDSPEATNEEEEKKCVSIEEVKVAEVVYS